MDKDELDRINKIIDDHFDGDSDLFLSNLKVKYIFFGIVGSFLTGSSISLLLSSGKLTPLILLIIGVLFIILGHNINNTYRKYKYR
jgi:1,4-dihydroxy-2-naphthoate octaprenyltransferase